MYEVPNLHNFKKDISWRYMTVLLLERALLD